MDDDDSPAGLILTRREALSLLGASGFALLSQSAIARDLPAAGAPGPACVVRPEQTEGPYFVDERLRRSDIRVDPTDGTLRPGAPLALAFHVSRIGGGRCAPLAEVRVDLWHCDADGRYSDVRDPMFRTSGRKFLRGYQVTDAAGRVRFVTIYPGWYPGRTVHIHFKIRTTPPARPLDFTSQLYFPDALTDRVHALSPYSRRGRRTLRNDGDGIFADGGRELTLDPKASGKGYSAAFAIGLEMA